MIISEPFSIKYNKIASTLVFTTSSQLFCCSFIGFKCNLRFNHNEYTEIFPKIELPLSNIYENSK